MHRACRDGLEWPRLTISGPPPVDGRMCTARRSWLPPEVPPRIHHERHDSSCRAGPCDRQSCIVPGRDSPCRAPAPLSATGGHPGPCADRGTPCTRCFLHIPRSACRRRRSRPWPLAPENPRSWTGPSRRSDRWDDRRRDLNGGRHPRSAPAARTETPIGPRAATRSSDIVGNCATRAQPPVPVPRGPEHRSTSEACSSARLGQLRAIRDTGYNPRPPAVRARRR